MPDKEPILIFTTNQWRFMIGRVNAGQASLDQFIEQLDSRFEGTWAAEIDPDFRNWGPDLNVKRYSSVGDLKDIAQGTPGTNQWLMDTSPHTSIPTPGGVLFSPPPIAVDVPAIITPIQTGGPVVLLNPGVVPQLLRVVQQVMKAIGGGVGRSGGWRGSLNAILGALGVSQVVDIVDQWIPGLGDNDKDKIAIVIEAFAMLEDAGLVHPWNPRARRDGTQAPGPYYFIFDVTQVQGHWTNFHMSRGGLKSHDEKKDTIKRRSRPKRRNS